MTVTDGYISGPELAAYLSIGVNSDDDKIADAINAASRAIDKFCNRRFASTISGSTAAVARTFKPGDWYCLHTPDFHTLTSVKTDQDDDGVFETTWTASDYELSSPLVDEEPGWPYTKIRAVGDYRFPVPLTAQGRIYTVEVTAQWGWASVPEPVRQACLQVSAEMFRRKDAPFGVMQTVDYGPMRLGADSLRAVAGLLNPYVKRPVLVG